MSENSLPKSANFDSFLLAGVRSGASDVHFKTGIIPYVRLNGEIVEFEKTDYAVNEIDLERFLRGVLKDRITDLQEKRNLDFSLKIGAQRFRGNAGYDQNGLYSVFRIIPNKIIDASDVGFPFELWEDLINLNEGLVLVTGVTGSGKSTTLASLIDKINSEQTSHIITIEDPVEYVYQSRKSKISQRELGTDVNSFADGVKYSLRQDPDIILIGEIRDKETADYALKAAETGHLVFSTLHTKSAEETIERYVGLFEPALQDKTRISLSSNLAYVLSQQLIPYQKSRGRVLAMESMNVKDSPAIKNHIRSGDNHKILSEIQTGRNRKMITMDQRLIEILKEGKINKEQAIRYSHNIRELDKY